MAQGKAAEKQAKVDLEKAGNKVIRSQVTMKTAAGNRVVDFIIQTPSRKIQAVEVKSGNAKVVFISSCQG